MKKKHSILVGFAVIGLAAFAENAAEIGSVRLKGYLGERLDAMIAWHVGGADVDYITAPFQEKTETKGWWQTEFWGKWMHSAVPYLGYCGSERLRASVDRGIRDGQSMPAFAAVRSPSDDMWMAFSATLPLGSHHENPEGKYPETVFFCDYASAGNTWRRDNFYRAWFPVEFGPME